MTRDETVALFLRGREAWNEWAEKMLTERKMLEADGRWSVRVATLNEIAGGKFSWVPKNDDTRAWIENARIDFSNCRFLSKNDETSDQEIDHNRVWPLIGELPIITDQPQKTVNR